MRNQHRKIPVSDLKPLPPVDSETISMHPKISDAPLSTTERWKAMELKREREQAWTKDSKWANAVANRGREVV